MRNDWGPITSKMKLEHEIFDFHPKFSKIQKVFFEVLSTCMDYH